MSTRISLIAAMAQNRTIGINNTLPWRLPGELKYFKAVTMGHHILMGRKTYESIGKPLPGRTTVIITRNADYTAEGCTIANSIDAAIHASASDNEIFFVGGAELYSQALAIADRLYLTEIQKNYEGDAHFPAFDYHQWHEVNREKHKTDEPDGLEFHFVVYDRK